MFTKTIVAIITIGILLVVALLKGFDGVLLAGGLTIIAGLAGFSAGKLKKP